MTNEHFSMIMISLHSVKLFDAIINFLYPDILIRYHLKRAS